MKLKNLCIVVLSCLLIIVAAALAACTSEKIPVVSVTLNKTTLVMEEGQIEELIATVTPSDATDKTVTWKSDNETVVTVSEGTVVAVEKGTAVITAAADGKSATCAVTVNEAFDLNVYKTSLCAQLDQYKSESLYNLANEEKVAETKDNGKSAINAATDKSAADKAFSESKTAIDAIAEIKIFATVNSVEAILNAAAKVNENEAIVIQNGVYKFDTGISIVSDGVYIVGKGEVVLEKTGEDTDSIFTVAADNVTLKNLNVRVAGSVGANNSAHVYASGANFTMCGCTIERSMEDLTEQVINYGLLVRANNGVFTAKDCTFIAPYNPEFAFAHSPSVIEATSGVDLDGCTIKTDGYGFFSQHVTKGVVKNTLFTGIDDRPICCCINSTLFDGIVFDGCVFDMGRNSTVTAGSFTFKNCVFNFDNTPEDGASNAINVYMQTGAVIIENNIFNLKEGVRGINFTSATWADGSHDGSQVSVKGNIFNGNGKNAVYVKATWENFSEADFENNTVNGNKIEFEPEA